MAKWIRKVTFADDTAQSIMSLNITGVEGVTKFLEISKRNVLRLADNLSTKTATEARKIASKAEANGLTLNSETNKWVKGKGWQEGGSVWDSKLGGYKSLREIHRKDPKADPHLRLINFQNKKTAAFYPKSKGFGQSADGSSVVRMTSNIANLWENNAYYTKASSPWVTPSGGKARWKKGSTREGKHYFSRIFTSAVNNAVPTAITEAKRKFREDQRKAKENKG